MSQNKEVVRQRKIMNLISGIGASRRITRAHFIALESLEPGLVSEDMICEDRPADADDSELAKELVGSLENMRTVAIGGALLALIGMIIAFFRKGGGGGGSGGGGSGGGPIKSSHDVKKIQDALTQAEKDTKAKHQKMIDDLDEVIHNIHATNPDMLRVAEKGFSKVQTVLDPDRKKQILTSAVKIHDYFFKPQNWESDIVRECIRPVLYNCLVAQNAHEQQKFLHDVVDWAEKSIDIFIRTLSDCADTIGKASAGGVNVDEFQSQIETALEPLNVLSTHSPLLARGYQLYPDVQRPPTDDPAMLVEVLRHFVKNAFSYDEAAADAKLKSIYYVGDFNKLWSTVGETAIVANKIAESAEKHQSHIEVNILRINDVMVDLKQNENMSDDTKEFVRYASQAASAVVDVTKDIIQIAMGTYSHVNKIVAASGKLTRALEHIPAFDEELKATFKKDKVQI